MPFKREPHKYGVWQAMLRRCHCESHPEYGRYGGRGINVCEEWSSYKIFIADMGKCPDGHSLERVDNDKGYSKDNCIWADNSTQSANQRKRTDNSTGFTGVYKDKRRNLFYTRVQFQGIIIFTASGFIEAVQAAAARDKFITQNNLPHRTSS